MKKINIAYWIFTILFSILMLGSAIPDIFSMQIAIDGFGKMGMPAYLLPFLGVAKLLGVIAILYPVSARIKEWAYAGLIFDLIGATYSIAASGQSVTDTIGMILPLSLAAASYILYLKRAKLKNAKLEDNKGSSVIPQQLVQA